MSMHKTKEPLFHIVKRGDMPWHFSWSIRATAIVLALICCSLITTLVTSENPIQIFATIIDGSLGSTRKFMVLLQNTAMLLCVSLAPPSRCASGTSAVKARPLPVPWLPRPA